MMKYLLLTVLLVAISAGCSQGEQKGKFAVSHARSHFFNSPDAFVLEFKGNSLNPRNEINREELGLLYVVFVGENEFSNGYNHAKVKNDVYSSSYTIQSGRETFGVLWDRKTDLVKIAGEEIDRTIGNAIVVTQDERNGLIMTQVNVGLEVASIPELLRLIADKKPNFAQLRNCVEGG